MGGWVPAQRRRQLWWGLGLCVFPACLRLSSRCTLLLPAPHPGWPLCPPRAPPAAASQFCKVNFALRGRGANPVTCMATECGFK